MEGGINIDRNESRAFVITFNTITETVDASVKGFMIVCHENAMRGAMGPERILI